MHPSNDAAAGPDAAAQIEMPRYQSHKKVWALKIESVTFMGIVAAAYKLTFDDKRYAPIECEEKMFSRYTPVKGDYYVVYDDGYKSFSPAKAFEDGYTLVKTEGPAGPTLTHAEIEAKPEAC